MGNTTSKSGGKKTGESFFPLNERVDHDLDTLSFAAARILSTPDIYDITNLANPGICGNYAVFLKKNIEKKLMPILVDISGQKAAEVLYQNPLKSITDVGTRKKICEDLADTMVRAITIVLACLASIQVKSESREQEVARVPKIVDGYTMYPQTGGSISTIFNWLLANNYIPSSAQSRSGVPIEFRVPNAPQSSITYRLTFIKADDVVTTALLTGATSTPPFLEQGYIELKFMNPVPLPIPGQTVSVLPVQVRDAGPVTWSAGVFYKTVYKPFSAAEPFLITDLFEMILRRTPYNLFPRKFETLDQIKQGDSVFESQRRSRDPQILFNTLGAFFSRYETQYQPGYRPPGFAGFPGFVAPGFVAPGFPGYAAPSFVAPPVAPGFPGYTAPGLPGYGAPGLPGYGAPGYGAPGLPGYGAPGYGAPGYGAPGYGAPRYGIGTAAGPLYGARLNGAYTYDIPEAAGRGIIRTLREFRNLIAKESSPAYARARMLAGVQQPDRSYHTNVCDDDYWKGGNLNRIYPWATFQFLSIKDWSKMDSRTGDIFHAEWTSFIDDLRNNIYPASTDYPKLTAPTAFLETMKFDNRDKITICGGRTDRREVPVKNSQKVNDGLRAIQTIYTHHVGHVWKILNGLILVIKDPETGQDIVRLHPNVTRGVGKESSKEYVERKATEARRLLAKFYADIETAYKTAVLSLIPLPPSKT